MSWRGGRVCMLGASLWLAAGCAAHKPLPTKHTWCERARFQHLDLQRPLRPADWIDLLLVTEQRSAGRKAQSLCTGERIEHQRLPPACEVQTPDPGVLEPVPLTEASVHERMLPADKRLVWIMTHRFPNGDGFGPIASIQMHDHGLAIEALGLLRLRPQRVDLALWQVGANTVLMAAGESCLDDQDPKSCRRSANLLVFDRDRFYSAAIERTGSRQCIDAPWIEFKREADLTLDNGWNRHMRISSTLDHDARYVVITEQVVVADTDPNHADIPARDVRRIDAERFIHVEGTRLSSRQSPLWPRIIPTQGQLRVRADSD